MRIKQLASFILLAGLNWQIAAAANATDLALDLLLQKAHSLEARSRTDLAAQVWQEILVTHPDQSDALSGLARWAQQSGNLAEANAYLNRLRKASPDSPALASFSRPSNTQYNKTRLERAAQLAAGKHYEDAMAIYTEVFGSKPPAGGWAIAYYQTEAQIAGRMDDAVKNLRRLADFYPDVPDYRVALGSVLTYRPETRHQGIAELASLKGDTPMTRKAQEAWRQALVWEKNNPAFAAEIRDYVSRYPDQELSGGLESLRARSTQVTATETDRLEQRGYAALKGGRLEESEDDFRTALQKNPKNDGAHAGLGFLRMKSGAFNEAVQEFESAAAIAPSDRNYRDALRTAQFWSDMQKATQTGARNDWPSAIQEYKAALVLREHQADALRGLAGAYLRSHNSKDAEHLAKELVARPGAEADDWNMLLTAQNDLDPKAAAETLRSLPEWISRKLSDRPEFMILQASIAAHGGNLEETRRIIRRLPSADGLTDDVKFALANLQLQLGEPVSAVPTLRALAAQNPQRPDIWRSLVSALVAAHEPDEAETALSRMPASITDGLHNDPDFLQTLATMEEDLGDTGRAIEDLSKALGLVPADSEAGSSLRDGVKLHLASLLTKSGNIDRAESLLQDVVTAHPENDAAWKAYIGTLQQLHQYDAVLRQFHNMPSGVAFRLSRDYSLVSAWAEAQAKTGNAEQAILLLQNHLHATKGRGGAAPASVQMQLSWLLFNTPGREHELYRILQDLQSRTDLNAEEKQETARIWVSWILRTAETSKKQGDLVRAQKTLQQGMLSFPAEDQLKGAYAGLLLESGNTKSAFNAYSNWGLQHATASDYAGAIGAAMTLHSFQYADSWIPKSLTLWPSDPTLLQLAGDRAKIKGEYKQAERYWRAALQTKQATTPNETASSQVNLEALLIGTDQPATPRIGRDPAIVPVSSTESDASPVAVRTVALDMLPNTAASKPASESTRQRSSFIDPAIPGGHTFRTDMKETGTSTADDLSDRIAGVESRNTPMLTSGVTLGSRSGQPGFDRMLIEQADFEASTVLSNDVRVTLAAKPTYLEGGTPDGASTLRFGSSPVGANFGPQTASGIAGEAQISSTNYGLRIGGSPYGFLTHTIIGGIRLDPGSGPFTFLLSRDNVKDTLLSYSGARDPVTNSVWGGVVSNMASVQGHWGSEQSGLYADLEYQLLSGKNVASNRAVDGTFGTYWQVMKGPHDSLTLGTNFSAMHYEKNLRYFTLGQGGYFSPQQYFLFGIPFRWTGTYYERLQYSIGGSLGVQHFTEDLSSMFPTRPWLQTGADSYYPAFSNTGVNFSFDGKLTYQIAPQWFVGAFLSANNARNYTSASGGFLVKYTFEPKPLGFKNNAVPSVPDWRGQQALALF